MLAEARRRAAQRDGRARKLDRTADQAHGLAVGGVGVACLPTIWVGDHQPVDATVIVDQFYFAATADYLTDHPLLPAPPWSAEDPVGSAPPAAGPVVDVVSNRLRYGQAAVAAALSTVVGQPPAATVTSLSIEPASFAKMLRLVTWSSTMRMSAIQRAPDVSDAGVIFKPAVCN